MFHVKQSEDFSKIFCVKHKSQQNSGRKDKVYFQNLVEKYSEKTEKNREKLKKMLAFPCFLCYNH